MHAGFQAIPTLSPLEGMLNSLAPADSTDHSQGENYDHQGVQKPVAVVHHRGALGFLQAFLKLQQRLAAFQAAREPEQVRLQSGDSVQDTAATVISVCHVHPTPRPPLEAVGMTASRHNLSTGSLLYHHRNLSILARLTGNRSS